MYNLCTKLWNEFEMKNIGEYHDLYLKTDVLLIADVFEVFRNMRLKYYGQDLRLICDAMFKMTDVELDLSSDTDMYQFIEEIGIVKLMINI